MEYAKKIQVKDRIPIKGIYILRYDKSRTHPTSARQYGIAILTGTDKYVEFEFCIYRLGLTADLASRIQTLFQNFRFVPKSMVIFSEDVKPTEPLYIFIRILASNIGFYIHQTPLSKMSSRVMRLGGKRLHMSDDVMKRGANISNWCMHRIWKNIIKYNKCPWITAEYDKFINENYAKVKRLKKRILRFGAYYMALAQYAEEKCQIYRTRKKAEQKTKQEADNAILSAEASHAVEFTPDVGIFS